MPLVLKPLFLSAKSTLFNLISNTLLKTISLTTISKWNSSSDDFPYMGVHSGKNL